MAKHAEIYPSPEELTAVQEMVSSVECALKTVSDRIGIPTDKEQDSTAQRWEQWLVKVCLIIQ